MEQGVASSCSPDKAFYGTEHSQAQHWTVIWASTIRVNGDFFLL
jgi:hypothetical protein